MKLILDDGRELNVTLSEEEIAKLCTKKDVMWFPENGEEAWYIDEDDVKDGTYWSRDNKYDILKHKLGHIFKTKEEAEKHLALIEAKYKVRKRIAELNKGWIPDWNDGTQVKYFIERFRNTLDVENLTVTKYQPDWMYIKSVEIAEQLIEELEPELRLVLEE